MDKTIFGSIPFIPGTPPVKPELLGRYLPPIPENVFSSWLKFNVPAGRWVLDPFGSTPRVALEAARAGYRILVAANNPIIRFLIEMMAEPPAVSDLKASLAGLAASFIGVERIEPHIRSLYSTICARCGQVISAEAFLWEQGNPTPYARIYTCPYCGDSGDHPSTPYDAEHSSAFITTGLHKARALERVVAFNDQDRIHVEQALAVYTPRALYALITIINKLQGLPIPPKDQKNLTLLLLYAFDQANSMWRPQAQNDRRRQLTIPRHYRENNIWCALEEAINKWGSDKASGINASIPVTTWPILPPSTGGICIYEGRLINLIDSVRDIDIDAVCTALPRPNQAYWTLSALWAGWLWGREAVGTFKSVLHRQRYDWAWHTTALTSVFKQLANFLKPSTALLGVIGEAEPGFIASAMVAASIGGCHLMNIALRPDDKQAQLAWKSEKSHVSYQVGSSLTQAASRSARQFLVLLAEPASYLSTISAALIGIINEWKPDNEDQSRQQADQADNQPDSAQTAATIEPTPSSIYTSAYASAREALSYRMGFLNYSLHDEMNPEMAIKNQISPTTLFPLEITGTLEMDEESYPMELVSSENEAVVDRQRLVRSSDVTESSFLWLREAGEIDQIASSDIQEAFLANYLLTHPGCSPSEIDQATCQEFPGLFTPDANFIKLCLDSYGLPDSQDPNHWFLRHEDGREERQSDIEQISAYLHQIGVRLGFDCTEHLLRDSKPYIVWRDEPPKLEYRFFITTSAAISEIVIHDDQPLTRGYIVFPASRTNLLIYKLRRDPRLNRAFSPSQGMWHLLKFRHLRSLSESPLLTRDNMDQMFGLDPLTFSTPQLWLI
jgi:hypothetical protein